MNRKILSAEICKDLEQEISAALQRFLHIGAAFRQIRDQDLYHEIGFESFGDYIEERFGLSRSQVYRLMDAEAVMRNLEGMALMPINERQCRPLVKFSPKEQREIWQAAVDQARSKRRPTSVEVEAAVRIYHMSTKHD
jgi:hypothetical protein